VGLAAADTITVVPRTIPFAASVTDSAGLVLPDAHLVWTVSDPGRGRVDAVGTFTAGPDTGRVWVQVAVLGHALPRDSAAVRVVAPGTVKWTWAAAEAGGAMPIFGGPALGADGTVYVIVETNTSADLARLVALDSNGRERWRAELTGVELNYPLVTPAGDVLVAGPRVHLLGADGTPRWQVLSDASNSAPHSAAATLDRVVVTQGRYTTAFRLSDADTLWQSALSPLGAWLVPPTIVGTDLVYAKLADDSLYALRLTDGEVVRAFEDPDSLLDKRVFGVGTVPLGGRLYLPTASRLAAFDPAGPLLWLTDEHSRGTTEPAVGPDGTLYGQNRRWGVEALNPDGSTKWYRRTLGAVGNWKEAPRWSWYGGPALAEGSIVYAAGREAFFAYTTDGALLWTQVVDSAGQPQAFVGAPAIAQDGTVYTFTSTHLYAFWGPSPPEPNSPWPMWRRDAQRTGWVR
jgi:outer membrane protein assembly factor BamB